jgi:hypothetical protein
MALTTLSDLKTFLGVSDTSEDVKLAAMITLATSAIEGYLDRVIESATYTEYYGGDGSRMLLVQQRPVTAVTSVHVDQSAYAGQAAGAFASATEWTAGEDFFIRTVVENESNTGELVAIKGPGTFRPDGDPQTWGEWPSGTGNIKVVYTAGYSTVPSDITLACNLIIAELRNTADKGRDIQSEHLGSYSYTLASGGTQGVISAREIVNRYRNMILI